MSVPFTSTKSSTKRSTEKNQDSENTVENHPIASTSQSPAEKKSTKREKGSCLIAVGNCNCPTADEPKPGPSTTAADFDLEVFDSCSSCSLEDCWGIGCPNSSCESSPISRTPPSGTLVSRSSHNKSFHRKGNVKSATKSCASSKGPRRSCRGKAAASTCIVIHSDLSDNSSEEDIGMSSPQINKILVTEDDREVSGTVADMDNINATVGEPASACPSETEEASDREDEDEPNVPTVNEESSDVPGGECDHALTSRRCLCSRTGNCNGATQHDAGACREIDGSSGCWVNLPHPVSCGSVPNSSKNCQSPSERGDSNCHEQPELDDPDFLEEGGDARSCEKETDDQLPNAQPVGSYCNDHIDEIVQDHDNFGTDENEDSLDAVVTLPCKELSKIHRQLAFDDALPDCPSEGNSSAGKRKTGRTSPDICRKKKRLGVPHSTVAKSSPDVSVTRTEGVSDVNMASCSSIGNKEGDPSNLPVAEEMRCDTEHMSGDCAVAVGASHLVSDDLDAETEFCSTPLNATTLDAATSTRSKTRLSCVGNNEVGEGVSTKTIAVSGSSPCSSPRIRKASQHQDQQMKLIPDKDNPPREMLEWVETFSRWSHAQRLLAIDQLIGTCEPTQVRHMMAVIEPQFQRDFISLLPKELALYVLCFLKPRDLLNAAQTCRYWRILAEDNLLWREKCREAGLEDVKEMLNNRRKKPAASSFAYSTWKLGFMREHNIECNWRTRSVRTPKVLKGHDDHVITCLQFSQNRIVSGSDDNTLKVWNASNGRCLRTLIGHTGGVWSSQMEGNVIVSGSTDRTLKVWNADTGSCEHTLYGHTSTVRCMHMHQNLVVSGSRDATLRMWDIATGECLHVLMGHVAAVRCVQYDGRLVVSGAYDYMVKVWNPITEECLHTLTGHTNRVYSLQFDGVHVVSGSLDTSIRVWDVETGACKHALMGHQSLTSGMELKDNILVSGNADSTVKVWDITTGQCLQTLSGPNKHQSAVTCLQFNSKFVVTSSDDGTVKLWDVKTGEFIRDLVALKSGGSGGVVWRIRANATKLVCAVGSRNGTEETKLFVLDFDMTESK